MKNVTNKLRVLHYPNITSDEPFIVEVKDEEQAFFAINLIANQHLWLKEMGIIQDYSNMILVELYDENICEMTGKPYEWVGYWNDEECMDWDDIEENYFN
jgi:hypothetical protein